MLKYVYFLKVNILCIEWAYIFFIKDSFLIMFKKISIVNPFLFLILKYYKHPILYIISK